MYGVECILVHMTVYGEDSNIGLVTLYNSENWLNMIPTWHVATECASSTPTYLTY